MSSVELRKEFFADERPEGLNEIGQPKIRQDILGHVTGRSEFYDDHLYEGLLHMSIVRSTEHHARIRNIDVSQAETMPGVVRIVRAADVPVNLNTLLGMIGFGRDDEALLQEKRVAYKGEAILAVLAESELQARNACKAVRVDYEPLPHVLDVEEALKPEAPVVNDEYPNNTFDYHDLYDHQKLRFGDVNKAFAECDHVVEGEYSMSPIEQAPLETCGAIAVPETNDRYRCHTCSQGLFFSLGTTAKLLDMPSSRLHFIGGTVGGGFGGKVDSLNEPMAVLGSMLTGRPVKFTWDRAEEMQVGAPRGAEKWRIRDGVMNDGRIVAREFTGFFDSGAYTRLSSYAVIKGTAHLPGPYSIPNVSSNVYCVYTNRTPATAMRGFGITGVDFAIECHMDKVAEKVGMNPIELRMLNAYRDGDMKPHRRLAKNTALLECCQVAAEKGQWAIGSQYSAMSSLRDGGGEKAAIPPTIIDEEGRIGERKAGRVADAAPSRNGKLSTKPNSTVPILEATMAMGEEANVPLEIGRQREAVENMPVRPAATVSSITRPVPPSSQPTSSTPVPAPPIPTPAVVSPAASPVSVSAFARPLGVPSAAPTPSAPDTAAPRQPVAEPQPAPTASPSPPSPAGPGVRRPGSSPFVSGRRGR